MPMPAISSHQHEAPVAEADAPDAKTVALTDSKSASPPTASGPRVVGSHEVRPKTGRRRFTWEDKNRIVAEASLCTKRGEISALLRREGIYSSQLSEWRRAVADKASEPKRGRPAKMSEKDRQIASLERHVARLEAEAKRSAALLELQKKAFQLLEAAEALGTH